MGPEPTQRPHWDIDKRLECLIGHDVRVAARSFAPLRPTGENSSRFIPVRDLFLPDNSQPRGVPVYFEGRLRQFERRVGVVYVHLESPASLETAANGQILFRGRSAVILHGPAVVELAFPFQVEKLPADGDNY